MTLATMSNNILRYCPGLQSELVKSVIQDSYRQLCSMDWSRLKLQKQITTSAPYVTGTVAVSSGGTVTLSGLGAAFTAGMVGSFMRVHYSDAFFQIATVTPPSTLTLTNWTGVVVAAGTSYTIFTTLYSVDSLFGIIFELEYQVQLGKKSQSYFNRIDPARTGTGDSPIYWAYAGTTPAGVIQVELYPVPSSVVPVRVYGKIKAATLADADYPYLPEDLVEARSLIDCYRMKEVQQPKMGWDQRAVAQLSPENPASYPALLQMYLDEDRQLDSHITKVRDRMEDSEGPIDDNFSLSHDYLE